MGGQHALGGRAKSGGRCLAPVVTRFFFPLSLSPPILCSALRRGRRCGSAAPEKWRLIEALPTVDGVEVGQALSDFELLGQVRDGESGVVLEGAWAGLSGTDWGSITDNEFRIPDTSAGQLSLTIEGLEVVTDRFRSRRNGFAGNVFAFDAGDLASTSDPTALDFVRYRSGSAVVTCNGRAGKCPSLEA